MVRSGFIFIVLCLVFTHCRKKEKDDVTQHDIKGMVFNNCTDSGLANVTVYLKDGQGLNLNTVSDANGNFIFPAVNIHSNSKYTYNIYIPSKSGGISSNPALTEIGITGTSLYFNYDEADIFFKPRVSPRYLSLNLFCNKSPITNVNDSIMFFFTNNIFHKNVADYPYKFGGGGFYGTTSYNIGNIGNYPMGKYNIDIDTWISGVHSTKKDSIYLQWGANKTYTINW